MLEALKFCSAVCLLNIINATLEDELNPDPLQSYDSKSERCQPKYQNGVGKDEGYCSITIYDDVSEEGVNISSNNYGIRPNKIINDTASSQISTYTLIDECVAHNVGTKGENVISPVNDDYLSSKNLKNNSELPEILKVDNIQRQRRSSLNKKSNLLTIDDNSIIEQMENGLLKKTKTQNLSRK